MSDTVEPHINISTRPYLGDMLAPVAPAPTVAAPRAQENVQLWAAVNGGHVTAAPIVSAPQSLRRAVEEVPPEFVSDVVDQPVEGFLEVDWDIVAQLKKKLTSNDTIADRRTWTDFDVATASAGPETPFEEEQWRAIVGLVTKEAEYRSINEGADNTWGPLTRAHYTQAIFDTVFRYGRLQQYLREEDVEDISVVGYNNVVVTKSDGRKVSRPDMASSEGDLEDLVIRLAKDRGRSFSRGIGHLDLDLGGARLAVVGSTIATVTSFTVRKHNHVDIDLDTLEANKTVTAGINKFLAAASAANCCVLVAGFPTVGKTTFLRALASAIPVDDKIITIETERELYLEKLPHRHRQVVPLQELSPQLVSGDAVGGFTLEDGFNNAVRQGSERLFFAEIRAKEGPVAMKAMMSGRGAMSTIHARNADDAIHRFADVLMSEYRLSDDTVPLRQILRTINLIIYIDFLQLPDGTRRRIVTEVAEVVPTSNESGAPMAAQLFEYNWATNTYDQPNQPSRQLMRSLNRVGYSIDDFNERGA